MKERYDFFEWCCLLFFFLTTLGILALAVNEILLTRGLG